MSTLLQKGYQGRVMDGFPFFPPQASSVAWQVDLLLLVLIGLSVFFTLIVVIFILYFSAKYRRGKRADRSNPPTTSLRVELSWVFLLLFLGMSTYISAAFVYFNIYRPQPDALEIYVVGQQWMWKFQHPEGAMEINTLHIPRGRPVRLIMISEDVIHSAFIPAFRTKFDVLPGRYTNLRFEPTQTGEYHLFCAEYCGTDHSRMIGTVIVMEPREYQEWLAAGQVGAPMAETGQQLFQQSGCSSCHAEEDTARAPTLTGIFGLQRPLQDGRTVTADESYIRESILFPNEKIVAGYDPIMPSYEGRITEEQLVQLVSYIKSLGGANVINGTAGDRMDDREQGEGLPGVGP